MSAGRSLAEIEREIEQTRARMSLEIDALHERLRPRALLRRVVMSALAIGLGLAAGLLVQSRRRRLGP